MSACENPLSVIDVAIAVKKVIIAITPKSSGASSRATMMLTAICSSVEPAFSDRLHTTPFATLSTNRTIVWLEFASAAHISRAGYFDIRRTALRTETAPDGCYQIVVIQGGGLRYEIHCVVQKAVAVIGCGLA